MKKQVKQELHSKSIAELTKDLKEKKIEIGKMKMDHQMGKLKETSDLRNKKVEIAVISTIIKEKKTAELLDKKDVEEKKTEEKSKTVKAGKKSLSKSQDKGGSK